MKSIDFIWADQDFTVFPEGCLFWKQEGSLLFSDVHLGKDHYFRRNGISVPQISQVDAQTIVKLVQAIKPEYVVFLGDLLHVPDSQSLKKIVIELFGQLKVQVYWILGNHDPLIDFENSSIVQILTTYEARGIHLVHDTDNENLFPVIQGHIHPVARVSLLPKGSYRYPAPVSYTHL